MRIKVNLFALTGFGNQALKELLSQNVNVLKVYTRLETKDYPYFKEEQLMKLASKNGIPVMFIAKTGDWEIDEKADVNLCATFHRILKEKHLSMARHNINIHPSLLPSYKGPTPTNWMIHNKEKICGITAHYLTTRVDEGSIIYQKEYPLISKTDSELRKFLSLKVRDVVKFITASYPKYKAVKSNYAESYYGFFNKVKRDK